jgi:hypothetical protein
MNIRERILRVVIGLFVVALMVYVGIAVVGQVIPTWGATTSEVARSFPGDELYTNPAVNWTHAITINAPAASVWQWIAQIGERRGGFYSYSFIENQMGNGDVYHNADRIVPEWQNPRPGLAIIGGSLPMKLSLVEPGKWMLASSSGEMGWSWVWYLEPINANQTRLLVRMKLQPAGMTSSPGLDTAIGLGAFVMEQGMLQGIQARAEGNVPPAYSEGLEIAVWFFALAAGLIAGIFFVASKEWKLPLAIGVLTIPVLFFFTFWQPPIWSRLGLDLVLGAGLVWFVWNQSRSPVGQRIPRDPPGRITLKPLTR